MSNISSENDILTLIVHSGWHMKALEAVRALNLPDGWIAAGFVRNLVWDGLHGYPPTPLNDVDVVYFDPADTNEPTEKTYEGKLAALMPGVPWSVKNQARMHLKNNDAPYASTAEALCHWCETPTAVGVRLNGEKLELLAPLGIDDLVNGICRATPFTLQKPGKINDYRERVISKGWQRQWPKLDIRDIV
jgi:hypothetical protein